MLKRFVQGFKKILNSSKMAEVLSSVSELVSGATGEKRKQEDESYQESKKHKNKVPQMQGRADRRRKVALMMIYSGKGYHGVQMQKYDVPTIEVDLFKALAKAGLISQEDADVPQKMGFQRASRTDKGVSACGQVFSFKMLLNVDNLVEKINEHLPEQLRVIAYKRVTKGFDAKNKCCGRKYLYMAPSYMFAPFEKFITEEYRVTGDILQKVNETLGQFVGTHNFHNFTSGVKHNEACAKRYIKSFECGHPFIRDGIEFVIISVYGQSFMMHQIRKMIGLTSAIVRGFAGPEIMEKCREPEKVDVPKAPGTGLLLDQLMYTAYNKKFGRDGMHEIIDWVEYKEEIDNFKEKFIFSEIVKAEKEEKVMFNWLATIHNHRLDLPGDSGHLEAYVLIKKLDKMKKERAMSDSEKSGCSSDREAENSPGTNMDSVAMETASTNTPVVNQTNCAIPNAETETLSSDLHGVDHGVVPHSPNTVHKNQNNDEDGITDVQNCVPTDTDTVNSSHHLDENSEEFCENSIEEK